MRLVPALSLCVVLLASCSEPKAPDDRASTHDALMRSQALIDSGNASYRRADYQTSAKRYASAAVVAPEDPAAFYGLGMALSKLGRDEEARAAYAKARELAQEAPSPSRSARKTSRQ